MVELAFKILAMLMIAILLIVVISIFVMNVKNFSERTQQRIIKLDAILTIASLVIIAILLSIVFTGGLA